MRSAWDWQRGGRAGAAEADGWGRARELGRAIERKPTRAPSRRLEKRAAARERVEPEKQLRRPRPPLPLLRALSDACLHKQAACVHVVHRILNTAKPTADLVGEGNTRNDARRPARGYLSVPVWEYAFIGNQIQTKKQIRTT